MNLKINICIYMDLDNERLRIDIITFPISKHVLRKKTGLELIKRKYSSNSKCGLFLRIPVS